MEKTKAKAMTMGQSVPFSAPGVQIPDGALGVVALAGVVFLRAWVVLAAAVALAGVAHVSRQIYSLSFARYCHSMVLLRDCFCQFVGSLRPCYSGCERPICLLD